MDLSQTVTGRLHFFDACFEGYPFAKFQVCEMSSFPVDQSIILRHVEDQPDCPPQKTQTSWIEFRNPSTDWNGLSHPRFECTVGSTFFPMFHVVFLRKVDLKMDEFENFLRFMAWFTFLQVRPSVDLVGSGELSTEKLWSQVSEATVGWMFWKMCEIFHWISGIMTLRNKSSMIVWAFS